MGSIIALVTTWFPTIELHSTKMTSCGSAINRLAASYDPSLLYAMHQIQIRISGVYRVYAKNEFEGD
jgi:hypothetical protein